MACHTHRPRIKEAEVMLDSEITESLTRAKVAKTIDVAFVVDSTGSMKSRIENAKEKMKAIQEGICKMAGSGASVRFAVVAFRDYRDSPKVEVRRFTSDVQKVCSFLGKLKATGGGDNCEDVIGGLEEAIQLKWEAKTRILYLMCDAPPHGERFHDFGPSGSDLDKHPHDSRQWGPADQVIRQTVQLQIHLVGLQYDTCCKKMFQVFTEQRASLKALHEHGLQTLLFQPSNSAMDFVKCILKSTLHSLRTSLSHTVFATKAASSQPDLLGLVEHPEIKWQDFKKWPLVQVVVTSVNVQVMQMDPQTKTNSTVHFFYVRETPFASGRMRFAFPAVHEDGRRRVVVKVHKTKAYLAFA